MPHEKQFVAWCACESATGGSAESAAERLVEASDEPMGINPIFVADVKDVQRFEVGVYQVPHPRTGAVS